MPMNDRRTSRSRFCGPNRTPPGAAQTRGACEDELCTGRHKHEQMFEAANSPTVSGRDFVIETKAAYGELATSNVVPTQDKS